MDFTEGLKKLNTGNVCIGFDLTDSFSQLSYGLVEEEKVETLSYVAGSGNYLIPTCLFKRREVNQWYSGKEAMDMREKEDGIFIDKLLERARESEEIVVGEETFRTSALLALFMKRTLYMLNMIAPVSKICSFMVSVDLLDNKMVSILTEATKSLGLKTDNIFFQSHMESFYYYTIYQPVELWKRDVLLLDFTGEYLKSLRMECNNNTTPVVAFIDPNTFTSFGIDELDRVIPDSVEAIEYDKKLIEIIEEVTEGRFFSSVYFIGEGFKQYIFKESVKLMCQKGRVFEGNNLYSKGAAFAARNKMSKSILSESHVFLGNDKLKSNIGLNVVKRGENAYLPLLDAGVNWFEAKTSCDVILDKGNKISFVITPLTGKNPEAVDITLGDLPKRPPKTSRLHVEVEMLTESRMQVVVKDLGFGELFPSSNIEWKEEIDL